MTTMCNLGISVHFCEIINSVVKNTVTIFFTYYKEDISEAKGIMVLVKMA